jgi:hypothetical protein
MCVPQIIKNVSGMAYERNKKSTSTASSRLDACVGSPPIVLIEEKSEPGGLQVQLV